jgi:hypothetical protein
MYMILSLVFIWNQEGWKYFMNIDIFTSFYMRISHKHLFLLHHSQQVYNLLLIYLLQRIKLDMLHCFPATLKKLNLFL